MADSAFDGAHIATITVTHHPDISLLARQFAALPPACTKIVVDNASPPAQFGVLQAFCSGQPRTLMLCNEVNRGVAAAINQGILAAQEFNSLLTHVLLLDQDSLPAPGSIVALDDEYRSLRVSSHKVGAVGPQLIDADTGLPHGFHQLRGWRWHRCYPTAGEVAPIRIHSLNGSGTYLRLDDFLRWGGLDEALFIDHVDTQWSFHLQSLGMSLWGVPKAIFHHSMGRATQRLWLLGWRPWPSRSPLRHYYLYRNTLHLLRRGPAPAVWRFWALARLLFNYALQWTAGTEGVAQRRAMRQGLADGWRGRLGPAPPSDEYSRPTE